MKMIKKKKNEMDIEECWKTDYLDENTLIPFKFGLISIYSPKHIGGLKTFCFKIRGLFEIEKQMEKKKEKTGNITSE